MGRGELVSIRCHATICSICQLPPSPEEFFLRGSLEEEVDQLYTMSREPSGEEFIFLGRTGTKIHQGSPGVWGIEELRTGREVASRNHSKPGYPIGAFLWTTRGGEEVVLGLTTCGVGQFGCTDGQCVPLASRCDNKLDCPDGADEGTCEVVERPPSYMADLPPLSNLSISVTIVEIVDTKEEENTVTIRFRLTLKWKDDRLKFLNLRRSPITNVLTPKEVKQIWVPDVDFPNLLEMIKTDGSGLVTVVREGDQLQNRSRGMVRDQVFLGSDHTLENKKHLTTKLTCNFALEQYPFDTQKCYIGIALQGPAGLSMEVLPEKIVYRGRNRSKLQQYEVKNVRLMKRSGPDLGNGVIVLIQLKRRAQGLLLTTYLPTIMMNVITQSTMYIDRDQFFETIMTTNITCMTVLASLYILFSSVVPQTSYLKSVDIWFLFNLTYPFCLIVLHVLIQKLRLEGREKVRAVAEEGGGGGRGLDWEGFWVIVGKVVMPAAALITIITYFICFV